jgi:Diaminopimelate decarboxylase
MREQGVKVDSVSLGEIERALAAGFDPKTDSDAIVFTADLIDDATLARVHVKIMSIRTFSYTLPQAVAIV